METNEVREPGRSRVKQPALDTSMFGGVHLGCKSPLLEPHSGYFLTRSPAMRQKMSLVRTPNRPFSLLKRHLQTCSIGKKS